jgi:hypothetical protein
MLQGLNIYTDASIPPDQTIMDNHNAGLGVFLQSSGPLHNFNVYIQANLASVSSVFTAEAAALALAAILVRRLNISEATFLSDNQQLVTYLNSTSAVQLPRWDAKIYTQHFKNASEGRHFRIYKISRNLNRTAHVLVSQARHNSHVSLGALALTNVTVTCNNPSHISSCPFRDALDHVIWGNLSHITASCC